MAHRSRSKPEQTETVRVAGREYPVCDRLSIGRRNYLILQRLATAPRQRLLAFDPYAGPGGELRSILILPKGAASRQHLQVLKTASANVNLPTILDYRPQRDQWQLVLQWIHGPDLKSYLADLRHRDNARWPSASEAFRLFRGLAHGLSQLHRRGIIHGDVHPGNLILTSNTTRVVPIDFGSAWQSERSLTRAEGDGLHPAYAAPEIQTAARFADFRSDQFSAAVVLYELLTLTLPYDGLGGKAGRPELAPTMAGKYVPPSQLSSDRKRLPRRIWQEIDRVTATGLAFNPDDRYPTPNAWLDEVERVFRGLQSQEPLSPLAEGVSRVVGWVVDRISKR
jgi:serine/threonine protein kinase